MFGLYLKNPIRFNTTKYLPNNYYEAKRLVSKFWLKVKKIDFCANDCMLFYDNDSGKKDASLLQCKFCGKLDITKSIQEEGKENNTIDIHVLLVYNSKLTNNICFNENNKTYEMSWWEKNIRHVTSSIIKTSLRVALT